MTVSDQLAEEGSQPRKRPRGRPAKSKPLIIRDAYWSMSLKAACPGMSFARLERVLLPHLKARLREDNEGYSQPFSLSKIARFQRGLSDSVDDLPQAVLNAEMLVRGSACAFTSILWRALALGPEARRRGVAADMVSAEVITRLRVDHFEPGCLGEWRLNLLGIRRLGRVAHRDAVGLLLLHSPLCDRVSENSLIAEQYARFVFDRACERDEALRAVRVQVLCCINEQLQNEPDPADCESTRLFLAPRVSAASVSLRLSSRE